MNYLRFSPSIDTFVALTAGLLCIGASALLIPFRRKPSSQIIHLLVRDLFMVFGLGFLLPISYSVLFKKASLASIGISLANWPLALLINIILALGLGLVFLKENRAAGKTIHLDLKDVFYVMVTGIFEVVFFYAFMRCYLELAFGILPAIIATSLFYSLHHVGFEVQMRGDSKPKEFAKLFFVGLMYASVFRVFNSFLAVFPFFWGVGALNDVLIEKGGTDFPWKNALAVLVLMAAAGAIIWSFHAT